MRHPQMVVFETDGRIATTLRTRVELHGWLMREPRRPEAVLEIVSRGGPTALIIRVGRDLEQEFALLDQVSQAFPDVAVVMILEEDHPRLRDLAWDLGAVCVMTLDQPREHLLALIEQLLGNRS